MTRILGRKVAHRKSLMRNLAASLILFEKIKTTEAKAKEVRSIVDESINIGKKQDLSSYRQLLSYFYDKNVVKKIRDELVKRYENRPSGYVRIYHIGNRLGDNSRMTQVELVDRKVFTTKKKAQPKVEEEKVEKTKAEIKTEKRLEKLTSRQQKSGIVTQVRTKAARKTGTSN